MFVISNKNNWNENSYIIMIGHDNYMSEIKLIVL